MSKKIGLLQRQNNLFQWQISDNLAESLGGQEYKQPKQDSKPKMTFSAISKHGT